MNVENDAPSDVTRLLQAARDQGESALEQVFPLVYEQLRALAIDQLRHERPGHTLQPTALVHEVYLKLLGGAPFDARDRQHFLAVAAQAIRRILIDHARGKKRLKRGGGQVRLELGTTALAAVDTDAELVAVDDALEQLAKLSPRRARVVELRFFAELTIEEAAEALGLSIDTVKADWRMAKLWLRSRMSDVE